MTIDRRRFLEAGSLACLGLLAPGLRGWSQDPTQVAGDILNPLADQQKILVLVELQGGNDGLNTVVPYLDDRYKQLRPRLALPGDRVIPLGTGELALHPALRPLMSDWDSEELAIILGVGYPSPNRSHFRSIAIWESGSDSEEVRESGWIARALSGRSRPHDQAADGLIVGGGDAGPLLGPGMTNISIANPDDFARRARALPPAKGASPRKALSHLLDVRQDLIKAAAAIEKKRESAPKLGVDFPRTRIGKQCQVASELIAAGVSCSVLKLHLGGFDTHTNQLPNHARLMGELAAALASFRRAMKKSDNWERVLLMTYSEFGRRAAENGSGGTDHGTAAPQFMMGGRVRGGLHGVQPDLGNLVKKDLVFTTDYRRIYSAVSRQWWDLPGVELTGDHSPLELIKKET